MEVLALSHLYISYEEAALNPNDREVNLLEGFNWQRLSLAWVHLLSSILALSILSVANKTLANTFYAQVEISQDLDNTSKEKNTIPVFWYPRFQKKITKITKDVIKGKEEVTEEEVDNIKKEAIPVKRWVYLSFCRTDGWCYITAYTENKNKPVEVGPNLKEIKQPAWVPSIYLCDDESWPLRDCEPKPERHEWENMQRNALSRFKSNPADGNLWLMNGSNLMDGNKTQLSDIEKSFKNIKDFCSDK